MLALFLVCCMTVTDSPAEKYKAACEKERTRLITQYSKAKNLNAQQKRYLTRLKDKSEPVVVYLTYPLKDGEVGQLRDSTVRVVRVINSELMKCEVSHSHTTYVASGNRVVPNHQTVTQLVTVKTPTKGIANDSGTTLTGVFGVSIALGEITLTPVVIK
jgi:hypothetical protein